MPSQPEILERPETLEECAAALEAGAVTSAELVERSLARMEAAAALNAFAVVRAEAARREAADADRRRRDGERGPVLGVPIAVKDDTDVSGEPTAFGCAGAFPAATRDAELVRRLRVAGAVIVGKTTTPELGQWPFTEGSFGRTANPWSPAHSPGGSSGGSAVAVSAGLVPVATGSDGAGSVRIPAAWTGLVGIKPQRGRISMWPDPEAFHGLTTHGILARTVADAARLLDAVSGNVAGDRHQLPPPAVPFREAARRPPGRLRVALSTAIPFSLVRTSLDSEVEAAVRRLGEVLAALGHDVFRADPRYGLVGLSFLPRSHAGLWEWSRRLPDTTVLDRRTAANCANGRRSRGPLLAAARASERWFARRIGAVFRDADVVLAPTTAKPPLPLGAADGLPNWRTDQLVASACPYAWPWNVLGWPAVNIPAGLTEGTDGTGRLPIGASLVGAEGSEALLLSLAAQLESVEGWPSRRPPGYGAGAGADPTSAAPSAPAGKRAGR